ncbi:MAG: molecular chaperone DnaJ [Bacteroidetes bacterium]|jgi:DnaJ-class molecular chaperone|nr:molecular chaperone DnaJ [Bacteroidota bacterium]
MRRIVDYRKLFNATKDTNLAELKTLYRNLMKEWHPDKFSEGDERAEEAAVKSKEIIEAYHFLVSVAPETHAAQLEEYTHVTNTFGIDDFEYKGQTLKITFQNGSIYEYFSVPKNIYNKLAGSATLARFARRHIYFSYQYRNVSNVTTVS